jgi:hypothetical protein
MGLLDKAKGMLSGREDKAKQGIDKGGDMLDDKTGGKYVDKVDMGQEKARDGIDKLSGE